MERAGLLSDPEAFPPKKEQSFSLLEKILLGVLGLFFISLIIAFAVMVTRPNTTMDVLLTGITAEGAKKTLYDLSYVPHIAGSPENLKAAQYLYDLYFELGLKPWNESFNVLINYPISRIVELVEPTYYNATMEEGSWDDGVPPEITAKAVPTFCGYSASGDVTAPLVYANYGRREDYEYLIEQNVNISGHVVIVRYGHIFRGDKCAQAERLGAVACLIYNDPIDDGYVRAESLGETVYAAGPWRTNTSVQRGSMWTGNGDPTTPGYPSTNNAPRLNYTQTQDPILSKGFPLPKIPIQPLAWGDAEPLLRALGGMEGPSDWQGGLNFTYRIGPGKAKVHVHLEQNYTMATIWNVYGKIEGAEEPDRIVLIGSHRDAWTFGAIDPISGTASVTEVARGFSALYKTGKWRPRRTIIFCSWDAEEYGLIGSMEYTDLHEKTLMQRAVAYFNFDVAVAGTDLFVPLGIPSMRRALMDAAKQVTVPGNASRTVYDMWLDSETGPDGEPTLPAPGAGSDFAGFIQRLGVPVCHLQMDSALEKSGMQPYLAAYHSNMDSYYWVTHFDDKAFEFHAAQARVMAILVKRFLDDQILPFNWTDYAVSLKQSVEALITHANKTNPAIDAVALFAPLSKSVAGFQAAAAVLHNDIKQNSKASGLTARALNDRLLQAERAFIDFNGLPGHEMLRNVVWAPGSFDSYAGELFPTISDAITLKQFDIVSQQVNYVTIFVDASASILRGDLV